MCAAWRDSFDQFMQDMGVRPLGFTLERKDVNGNYEPPNCVWASTAAQARNKRSSIFVNGKTLSEIADEAGTPRNTIYNRKKKGMPLDYVRPKVQHGTMSAYVGLKCRCDLCKKANSDYMKANRDRFPSMSSEYRKQKYREQRERKNGIPAGCS